jgi:chorismate-pyruvate lyase
MSFPMDLLRRNKLSDFTNARAALADLCEPFARGGPLAPNCVEVQPAAMPSAERRLLAHREHMTIILGDHHGAPVRVHVQEAIHDGDHYTRKILLAPTDSDRIVEAGIVRLNFHYMPEDVKNEILSRSKPLGQILIEHDVLRRIEPLWFVKFPARSNVLRLFDLSPRQPTYGRLATIFCDEEPAIELLETVLNTSASASNDTRLDPPL